MRGGGALVCTCPFQPSDFKREARVAFDRVQQGGEHPFQRLRSRMGSAVVFLKIQGAGTVKG